jgi:hypothetical protein
LIAGRAIFLDANVLFSAAKSDGAVRRLLAALERAGHECWADGFVAEEARRNLAAKFPDGLAVLEALLASLRLAPIQATDPALSGALPVAEKDRPVLAAAIRFHCDALVTGDRTHFGGLYAEAIHGVTIHSPRSIAEALLVEAPAAPKRLQQSRARYAVAGGPARRRARRRRSAAPRAG